MYLRMTDIEPCESSSFSLILTVFCLAWFLLHFAQRQSDLEGALIARDRCGIQDFVLLDEMTDTAFLSNLKKRFSEDLIYVSQK